MNKNQNDMKNKIKRALAAVGIVAGVFGVSAGIALLVKYKSKLAALVVLAIIFVASVCLIYQALRDGWDD